MAIPEYIGIQITCPDALREVMIAEMDMLGAEAMIETEQGIDAFMPDLQFVEEDYNGIRDRYAHSPVTFTLIRVPAQNWNEEWEKNYDPLVVEGKCYVRATFHKPGPQYPYEIVIIPRMSFGTGHHATTYLMLRHQLSLDHEDKRVLDAGCGTAILAIMAEKRGADEVIAYDNSSWTAENAPENLELNGCTRTRLLEGTINTLDLEGKFDIILANINKNVLLEEIPAYTSYLNDGGVLMLSGFYQDDEKDIIVRAEDCGLKFSDGALKDRWSALIFNK